MLLLQTCSATTTGLGRCQDLPVHQLVHLLGRAHERFVRTALPDVSLELMCGMRPRANNHNIVERVYFTIFPSVLQSRESLPANLADVRNAVTRVSLCHPARALRAQQGGSLVFSAVAHDQASAAALLLIRTLVGFNKNSPLNGVGGSGIGQFIACFHLLR